MTLNIQSGWTSISKPAAPVLASTDRLGIADSYIYEKAYATLTGEDGASWVREGLVVAITTVAGKKKYAPYMSDASYGTGSDTPVGILHQRVSLSLNHPFSTDKADRIVEPIYSGEVNSDYIYTQEDGMGAVPAAVKAALPLIYFRSGE